MSIQAPVAQMQWLDDRGRLTPEAHILLLEMTEAVNKATADITDIKSDYVALEARIVALEP